MDAFSGIAQDVAKALSMASASIQLANSRKRSLFEVNVLLDDAIKAELIPAESA